MRVIILADGPATRWADHPVPKHLVSINGEVLLHRTVRQLRERGLTDLWITSHNQCYEVEGTRRFEPHDNRFQIDQFYACHPLWAPSVYVKPVVFLYGDVYFSDAAVDTIVRATTSSYLYFQRTGESKVTGKPWKEGFAMMVTDTYSFWKALVELRDTLISGAARNSHHQLQGYLEGHGMGEYWGIGPHGVEIDDETDDFDVPEDIQVWLEHTSRWLWQKNQAPLRPEKE